MHPFRCIIFSSYPATNMGDTCAHDHHHYCAFPYLNCHYSCCHSHHHHPHPHPCHLLSDVKVEYVAVLLAVACKDKKKMERQSPGTTIRMSHKAIHISPFISQSWELQVHLKYRLSTHLKVHQPIILQFMLFDTNQPFI